MDKERRKLIRGIVGGALLYTLDKTGVSAATKIITPEVSIMVPQTQKAPQVIDCPIYMLHQPSTATLLSVVASFINERRVTIHISEAGEIISGEKDVPNYPVGCITFDDGYADQYEKAALLEQYNATATFFVMPSPGWEGDGRHLYMPSDQQKDLHLRGFELASHTLHHDDLRALRARNPGAEQAEVVESRKQLEDVIGGPVTSFAYPFGSFDSEIIGLVMENYKVAVSTRSTRIQTPDSLYYLGRLRRN